MTCTDKTHEMADIRLMAEQNVQLWKEVSYLRAENNHFRGVINNIKALVSTHKITEEPTDQLDCVKKESEGDAGESGLCICDL